MKYTKIKAGPIHHLTDARYFAAYGVDWLSFCFDPTSPDYLAPDAALQIKNWLAGPKIVGQFSHQDADNVREISGFLGLKAIQLNLPDFLHLWQPTDEPRLIDEAFWSQLEHIFIELPVGNQVPPELVEASAVLEETASANIYFQLNGSGDDMTALLNDTTEFERLYGTFASRVILDFPFAPDSLVELVSSVNPYGINLSGGTEEKVGMKDYGTLDQLLEILVYDS